MTMKLKVNRFRTRRPEPFVPRAVVAETPVAPAAAPVAPAAPRVTPTVNPPPSGIGDRAFFPTEDEDGFGGMTFPTARNQSPARALAPSGQGLPTNDDDAPRSIDGIRREGLTGRQLRMARRLAQKHGLPATSDFDAVRLLRAAGIDPFQTNSVLEMVSMDDPSVQSPSSRALTLTPGGDGVRLPQTIKPIQAPNTEQRAEHAHVAEVGRIQRDMARRRRRKSLLLAARLLVFVGLPAMLAAIYYYTIATPMYSAKTEFVIQQAEPAAAAGMGSLLRGTQMATSQDSIAVQGYLQSPDAMQRLNEDNGFRDHFSNPMIDSLQRLAPDAKNSAAYRWYKKHVKISYDPTEGIIKMEVIAADPQTAVAFSKALIGYAEDQVESLTQRLREDQMKGARESYDETEVKLTEANMRVVELQEKYKVLSSELEISLITTQIGQLDSLLQQDRLSLIQMESNESPNLARMEPLKRRIATLEAEIAKLRSKMTEDTSTGLSLARVQSELLVAQSDVATRQLLLSQSLQAMESARVEANRQTRYLSISVNPVAADEAAYPRAFENTLVALLLFAGLYLMISMTVAILREQVTA